MCTTDGLLTLTPRRCLIRGMDVKKNWILFLFSFFYNFLFSSCCFTFPFTRKKAHGTATSTDEAIRKGLKKSELATGTNDFATAEKKKICMRTDNHNLTDDANDLATTGTTRHSRWYKTTKLVRHDIAVGTKQLVQSTI